MENVYFKEEDKGKLYIAVCTTSGLYVRGYLFHIDDDHYILDGSTAYKVIPDSIRSVENNDNDSYTKAFKLLSVTMNSFGKAVDATVKFIESKASEAASNGLDRTVVFVPLKTASFDIAEKAIDRLVDDGFEASYKSNCVISDGVRCIAFDIDWSRPQKYQDLGYFSYMPTKDVIPEHKPHVDITNPAIFDFDNFAVVKKSKPADDYEAFDFDGYLAGNDTKVRII